MGHRTSEAVLCDYCGAICAQTPCSCECHSEHVAYKVPERDPDCPHGRMTAYGEGCSECVPFRVDAAHGWRA